MSTGFLAWLGRGTVAFLLAASLGACSTVRLVDNEVRSFAQWPAGQPQPGAGFKFERLPSQASFGEKQAQIEKLARAALEKQGLKYDEKAARWSVQIGVRAEREPRAPWDDPGPAFGLPGRDYVVTGTGQLIWVPPPIRMESPWYKRQVTLIIRDLASGAVAYETHAVHDGRWADGDAVLPAMFEAALKDFPHPPSGARRVDMQIPR